MNKARRKIIARAEELICEARVLLEQAADEEREYMDVMPPNLQLGSKGDDAGEMIQKLEEAVQTLENMDLET